MKDKKKEFALSVVLVIITSICYSLGVMIFLEPIKVYSSGIPGISQLISNVCKEFGGINVPMGALSLIFNIPILVIGWKYLSKRFAIYSSIAVLATSIFMFDSLVPHIEELNALDPLTMSVMGGLITGVSGGLALRFGTNTGGLDVVGQVVALRKNISIGNFYMIVNVGIAVVATLIFKDLNILIFTVIRNIITSIATDKVHTSYNFVAVDVITSKPKEVSDVIIALKRGCTILNGEGGYTHEEKYDVYSVISKYELHLLKEEVAKVDKNAFITVTNVKRIIGKFERKTIQ